MTLWQRTPAMLACALGLWMAWLPDFTAGTVGSASTALAQSSGAAPDKGVFWKVSGKGATSYLLGTVHIGAPCEVPVRDRVVRAIHGARLVMFELDLAPDGLARIIEFTQLPTGQRLETLIGADAFDKLRARLGVPLPADDLQRTKPEIALIRLALAGLEESAPLDMMLYGTAVAMGRPIRAMETPEQQFAAFDAIAQTRHVRMLIDTLAHDGMDSAKPADLIRLYLAGDLPGMLALSMAPLPAQLPAGVLAAAESYRKDLMDALLEKRNAVMLTSVVDEFAAGGVVAMAGALHLPGKSGFLEQLRGRGFTVEPADPGAALPTVCDAFRAQIKASRDAAPALQK